MTDDAQRIRTKLAEIGLTPQQIAAIEKLSVDEARAAAEPKLVSEQEKLITA